MKKMINTILRCVCVAMSVAVVVLMIMGKISEKDSCILLGIGLFCSSILSLESYEKKNKNIME